MEVTQFHPFYMCQWWLELHSHSMSWFVMILCNTVHWPTVRMWTNCCSIAKFSKVFENQKKCLFFHQQMVSSSIPPTQQTVGLDCCLVIVHWKDIEKLVRGKSCMQASLSKFRVTGIIWNKQMPPLFRSMVLLAMFGMQDSRCCWTIVVATNAYPC